MRARDFSSRNLKFIRRLSSSDLFQFSSKTSSCVTRLQTKLVFELDEPLLAEQLDTYDWNRAVIVPFTKSIERCDWDSNILDELWEDRNLIATMLAHTAYNLCNRNYKFRKCNIASTMEAEWVKGSMSVIKSFVDDCGVLTDNSSREFTHELYTAFIAYCQTSGIVPCSDQLFSRNIKATFHLTPMKWLAPDGNVTHRGFSGIKLRPEWCSKHN